MISAYNSEQFLKEESTPLQSYHFYQPPQNHARATFISDNISSSTSSNQVGEALLKNGFDFFNAREDSDSHSIELHKKRCYIDSKQTRRIIDRAIEGLV